MDPDHLYQLFIDANLEEGIEIDAWDDLDQTDKAIWASFAVLITKHTPD